MSKRRLASPPFEARRLVKEYQDQQVQSVPYNTAPPSVLRGRLTLSVRIDQVCSRRSLTTACRK